MSPLTLPGTIPGLLRRCSPVTDAEGVARGLIYAMPGHYRAYPDWWGVNWNYLLQPCDATRLYLDLSDPTGRAHAAWWLEAQPVWSGVYRRSEGAWWFGERFGIPNLSSGSFCAVARQRRAPWDFRWAVVVPSLANLVDDGRLLPDGSRWVDAEALRLVCLHVAGLSP